MNYRIESKLAKEFGRIVTLRRVVTESGWRGCWYSTDFCLNKSIERATRENNFSKNGGN